MEMTQVYALQYDAIDRAADRVYRAQASGRTCDDCRLCEKPGKGFVNPEKMGWCRDYEMFVKTCWEPLEIGCEAFNEKR